MPGDDLATSPRLRTAAEQLTTSGSGDAFAAWCEYARNVTADSAAADRRGLEIPAHDRAVDILLSLRRAVLGDKTALRGLEPDGEALAGSERVAIFAGAAGSMSPAAVTALERILGRALAGYAGTILSGGTDVGVPGVLGRVARAHGLRLVGYAPTGAADRQLYARVRETPRARDFSELEPLAMWTDILRAGVGVEAVRVVVSPGGMITFHEILLARALGATVGWLDPTGGSTVPLGDSDRSGVLELAADPNVIRTFLREGDG
jgi:hypothetical protein